MSNLIQQSNFINKYSCLPVLQILQILVSTTSLYKKLSPTERKLETIKIQKNTTQKYFNFEELLKKQKSLCSLILLEIEGYGRLLSDDLIELFEFLPSNA